MKMQNGVITMRQPDNWHTHLRDFAMMDLMVTLLRRYGWRGRIQAMPNTSVPLLTGSLVTGYRRIAWEKFLKSDEKFRHSPVVAMQLTEATTVAELAEALKQGVFMFKVYPRNVTTNSKNGVQNYDNIMAQLEFLEGKTAIFEGREHEAAVLFHGEHPSQDVRGINKETVFLRLLEDILARCPRLKVVLEHISSREAVHFVLKYWNMGRKIAATICVHYLVHTQDDLLGYTEASNFQLWALIACKPTYKFEPDRLELLWAATSGLPCFFYGGDDAPHPKLKKIAVQCCNGVANTVAALSTLIDIFMKAGEIFKLEDFLSCWGAKFYGFPLGEEEIRVIPSAWVVPHEIPIPGENDSLLNWKSGESMNWQVTP